MNEKRSESLVVVFEKAEIFHEKNSQVLISKWTSTRVIIVMNFHSAHGVYTAYTIFRPVTTYSINEGHKIHQIRTNYRSALPRLRFPRYTYYCDSVPGTRLCSYFIIITSTTSIDLYRICNIFLKFALITFHLNVLSGSKNIAATDETIWNISARGMP